MPATPFAQTDRMCPSLPRAPPKKNRDARRSPAPSIVVRLITWRTPGLVPVAQCMAHQLS